MTEPSIITLKIPNPFSEGRNRVYIIPSDPLTLIDTGTATERAFDNLEIELEQHGHSIRDIGRVVLTHKHIDHIGNAWRIQQASGAEIFIHERETDSISDVDPDSSKFKKLVWERLAGWSVPDDALPAAKDSAAMRWHIEAATPTGVVHGQLIDIGCGELEVLHMPGHTAGSICLKYGRLLFSGDHVLPDISPNIGGGDMRQRGLLEHFMNSLRQTISLDSEIDEVLPGHGDPFDHLAARSQELIDHHQQRLQKTADGLAREGPMTAYEMARCLFGEMRDFHVVLGCAEAQAHLDFLIDAGRVIFEQQRYRLTK